MWRIVLTEKGWVVYDYRNEFRFIATSLDQAAHYVYVHGGEQLTAEQRAKLTR